MDELVSSGEAARILGVAASTVKRWADTGQLECVKTIGRHRRFRRAEVEALAERSRDAAARARSPIDPEQRARVDPETDMMRLLLGERSVADVFAALCRERKRLGAWYRVADDVGEVLNEIGARWRDGRLSVMDEHVASERLARALLMCIESIPVAAHAPAALLITAEHEDHTLGLSLVELALRELGWRSIWAGRRTPIAEARRFVAGGAVELVCVSASILSGDAFDLRRQTDELIAACKPFGVEIVFGGRGAWPEPSYGHRHETFEEFHRFIAEDRARSR